MCGYPCSGKTRRAEELRVYFEQNCEPSRKVHIVGDAGLEVDRNTVYAGKYGELDFMFVSIMNSFHFVFLAIKSQKCDSWSESIADSQKEKNVRASLKAEVERWVCNNFVEPSVAFLLLPFFIVSIYSFRKVNKDDIVILDSLNYIKGKSTFWYADDIFVCFYISITIVFHLFFIGYRYELFCLTKHARTPHCLVSQSTSTFSNNIFIIIYF